ncbi:MAG TPA: hypothetical protein EYP77_09860 [Anaerolineae bacterium]|nr:hypothetical protein [Anaerolineae bacterium]
MVGARKSAKYILISSLLGKVISFIGSIVLARLLFPEDYSYLLMAMIISAFGQMIGDMGFEYYYLQEKITSRLQEQNILNITFLLRAITNIILFMLQYFGSYYAEVYFENIIVGEM